MVAGPNGVGKSTFARSVLSHIPYINGDEIKRLANLSGQRIDTFGLRILIQEKIHYHVQLRESFAMESNLVSNYSFDVVNDLSAKGFTTWLYYIGASELHILNERIAHRVAQGFHYVSPTDVKQRYREALQKLPSNLKYFDKAVLIDNSVQGREPIEVLHLEKGIIQWQSPDVPNWLAQILPNIQRLSAAYEKLMGRK